ncbi:hypothetical protein TUM19329_09990 [Legionella antarctica]|uniref:Uncharacterized protein n=1 Tax=Legionella antarctica TaxID=2708020 RepID=A0A6F8T2L9_9GAMM|nr:hypothetical protein TUM19329_09990 [Legionella antarctica]
MESFLSGSQAIAFTVALSKDERYQFIEAFLKRFGYLRHSAPMSEYHLTPCFQVINETGSQNPGLVQNFI